MFHYHLKCQDITDNRGDIEIYLIDSSQNSLFIDNYMKLCQFNTNQWDLKKIWMYLRKRWLLFHYHLKGQNITDNRFDIEIYLM